jgi:hypothetical protein
MLAISVTVGGCDQLEAAGEVTTPVHVDREPSALRVHAPAWFAPETLVVLCPTAPETVGEAFAPGQATIQLADTCHDYGRFASPTGLEARLELAELDSAALATFDATPDWWVVLIAVDGRSAGAIFDTQVAGGPIDPAVRAAPSAPD